MHFSTWQFSGDSTRRQVFLLCNYVFYSFLLCNYGSEFLLCNYGSKFSIGIKFTTWKQVFYLLTCFKKHSIIASGSSCQLQLSRAGRNRLHWGGIVHHVPKHMCRQVVHRDILLVERRDLWQCGEDGEQVIFQFWRCVFWGSRLNVQEVVLYEVFIHSWPSTQ